MSKILLVEDNEMNRDMLSRRLERKGFEVIIAVDGQQGVDMAGSESPALILMDLSLPVIDGWEATRRIKAAPATQSIPVVMITTKSQETDRIWGLRQGASQYLVKPVDAGELAAAVEAAIANE